MRRTVLSTFLFVAILGLGCMGVAVPGKADELCEENSPQYDPSECERQQSSSSGWLKNILSPSRDDGPKEGSCYENYRYATSWTSKASCHQSGGIIVAHNGQLKTCQKRRLSPEDCYRLVNRYADRSEVARRMVETKEEVVRHASDLIVRQFPSSDAIEIAYLRRDSEFTVQHKTNTGWAYIKFSNGRHGYVRSKDLTQVTAEKTPTSPADTGALKTSELNISFQTKKQGRIVKRKLPRKRAKAWFVGPDGKESAKTLTWDRKKKRYTTTIKHQDRKEVRVKVKAFGKYAAVSVLAQLDGGVQSIEMNLAKPILFIAWDPNLGLIKQKLRKKGVLRHTTALTNFIAAINTSSNRHHWSHLHVVDVNKDGAFREILSDLHGRAIQWNAKTNEGLKVKLRERVLSGAPVSPNKIIEPVGKFVSGFSYGPKATRAHLIYVLEKPTTGISNDDLKQMEDLLKQQRMSATILQFGHTDGEELKILTGGKKQFQRLQFVQADITKSFHNDYFFGAFDRAAQLVAAQTKRRLKQEKILLTAQLAEAKSVKARIPTPKLKPKAAKRLKAKPATEKRSTTSSGDFRKGMDTYERGDFTTALRKWKPLAEEGNARAQFWLGWMYENGKGTPENYRTALKWYRLAADQGHIFAKSSIRAHQEKVAKQKPTPKVEPRLYRTDAYVDVRANPSPDGKFFAELEKGKTVKVISETKDGRWLKIKWKGKDAYVKNRYLSAVQKPKKRSNPLRHRKAQAQRDPGDTFKDCADCPEMVVIPSGRFRMGDLHWEGSDDERPIREVSINDNFAIGMLEVTWAEWDTCVIDGACRNSQHKYSDRRNGLRPVININWNDAKVYVSWLSRRTRKLYRLPTEAEWEYAARAGSSSIYGYGNNHGDLCAHGNGDQGTISFFESSSCADGYVGQTAPVGSFRANAFGLYDMLGNAHEWVEDCWHNSYNDAPADGSAWIRRGDCSRHVLRGGSYDVKTRALRIARRDWKHPGISPNGIGFRVARTLSR